MRFRKDDKRASEAGRKGGARSGEVRRERRTETQRAAAIESAETEIAHARELTKKFGKDAANGLLARFALDETLPPLTRIRALGVFLTAKLKEDENATTAMDRFNAAQSIRKDGPDA